MRFKSFWVWWMGKWYGIKSKIIFFWLFITLETNVLLTMIVICGLKVLLWEAGSSVGRPGAGGIGTKTNSALNWSLVGVGVEADLGNKTKHVGIWGLALKSDDEVKDLCSKLIIGAKTGLKIFLWSYNREQQFFFWDQGHNSPRE